MTHLLVYVNALIRHFVTAKSRVFGGMGGGAIHLWRDNLSSIAYSEQLNSATISAFLQRTDRRYGILGQKPSGFQRILCEC